MRHPQGPWLVAVAATLWGTWSFYLRPAEAIGPISPFTETLFAGLKRCRAEQASALTLLEPLTAVCIGWVVWKEPMSALATLGMGLILASLFVVLRAPAPAGS